MELSEILKLCDHTLLRVDCTSGEICPRMEDCPTVGIWRDLGKLTSSFLDSKTLADIHADNKPVIMVFNKIDVVEKSDDSENPDYFENTDHTIFISAAKKQNIDTISSQSLFSLAGRQL